MRKVIINVELDKKDKFYNEYNGSRLSKNLSEYLIGECYGEGFGKSIVINIFHNFNLTKKEKEEMSNIIKMNYDLIVTDEEYYVKREKAIELILFAFGILFLIVYYSIIKDIEFFSELTLIMGWLAIWESVSNYIFGSLKRIVKIKRLKSLISAELNFIKK